MNTDKTDKTEEMNEALACRMPVEFDAGQSAPREFMYMPAGVRTITAFRQGKPTTVTLEVGPGTAEILNASLQAHAAASPHKPYFDFNHEHAEASFWPSGFVFRASPKAGVYCTGEWSRPGEEAVTGKSFRAFSPEFFLDKYTNEPQKPARVTGTPLCMGSLVNNPAFKDNLPLWARDAGSGEGRMSFPGLGGPGAAGAQSSEQTIRNKMKETTVEELAALQAKVIVLEQENKSLQAKAGEAGSKAEALKARETELEGVKAKLAEKETAIQAHRAEVAKGAVADAVKRGAILAKDAETQAWWTKEITANPEAAAILAKQAGNPALGGGRMTEGAMNARNGGNGSDLVIVAEDPRGAIRAYAAERNAMARGRIYKEVFSPILCKGGDLPIRAHLSEGMDALQAANSLGTLVGNIISQRVLELLRLALPMLTRISTDFSDEQVKYGQQVISRYITVPTVGTYNTGTGYPIADATATDAGVTINQHKCVQHTFTANDLSGTGRRLFEEYAPAASYALAKDLVDYVYTLITAANFTNAAIVAALIDFARSSVIDIGTAADKNGVPAFGRSLILNADYYGQLKKDPALITFAAFQEAEFFTDGKLPNVESFALLKAANLPATGNLVGFAMSLSALIAATRLPLDYSTVLPGASYGSVQTVTNADTGASVMQTAYVDHKLGTANWRLAWMYGASVGQQKAGNLLTSA